MGDIKKIPRVALPPGVGLSTLAVREGLPPSQWGENSEALFLTSSFVHPDAATAAALLRAKETSNTPRRSPGGAALEPESPLSLGLPAEAAAFAVPASAARHARLSAGGAKAGGPRRDRTFDPLVKSQVLYH